MIESSGSIRVCVTDSPVVNRDTGRELASSNVFEGLQGTALPVTSVQESIHDTEREARLCGLELALVAKALEPDAGSGDFVWIKRLNDGKVGVIVGDFQGHGHEAANGALGLSQILSDPDIINKASSSSPSDFLSYLDLNYTFNDRRVSLSFAKIDNFNRTLEYANAGLPKLEIIHLDGEVLTLDGWGVPLGGGDFSSTNSGTIRCELLPDDIVVMMTDGLTDACMYSGSIVHELLLRDPHAVFGSPQSPAQETERLVSMVQSFNDDCTIVAFRAAA